MATGERPSSGPSGENKNCENLGTRLDSWKEIASWLNRSEKTVRRWEETEGLPVHRLLHDKRSSVYAYSGELQTWRESRRFQEANSAPSDHQATHDEEREIHIEDPLIARYLQVNESRDAENPAAREFVVGTQPKSSSWQPAVILVGVVLAMTGLLVFMARGSLRYSILQTPNPPASIHSLAVLPFENLSGDMQQEYFADGMTAELITVMAKISSIRVISRTSVMRYKRIRKPLAEIAKELNVDAVVEGEVLRSQHKVRVTAQLIDVATDRHLWAETYDRDLRDMVALQADVAVSIAKAIGTKVMPSELGRVNTARSVDPEAYEDYLRGRFFLEKRTSEGMNRAVDYFQQAIRKDPGFAEAYAGLAKTYDLLGTFEVRPPTEVFPQAREAADRALQLDTTLSEAYTARGMASTMYDRDWNAAEHDFQQALLLNSNDALAHHWYAEHLVNVGHPERAITELERARELDPLSLPINGTLGRAYRDDRRFEESIAQCGKTLDLDPNFAYAHWCIGVSHVAQKHYADAIAEIQRAVAIDSAPLYTYGLGYAYAMAGNKTAANAAIEDLKQGSRKGYVPSYFIASIYAALAEPDQAFAWLVRAADERDPQITGLLCDPFMDSLRADSRFKALVRKIGFPQ
jgi:TolB-like protein/Tfp pilus assembly protein PilF